MPEEDILAQAYRRAVQITHLNRRMAEAAAEAEQAAERATPPADLSQWVRDRLDQEPERAWDDIIAELASEQSGEGGG